jgi:hypothetical protein
MAPSTKAKDTGQDDVDKMFEGNDDGDGVEVGDDIDDLLNEVEEDDSEGWVPTEKGEGIAGVVLKVGETRSDFADPDDKDPMCPTVTLQTKDGTKWRVIGYGAVLKRELRDADPKPGDTLAVKYFGEKPIKKGRFQGKPYKHFGVAVRRASANA